MPHAHSGRPAPQSNPKLLPSLRSNLHLRHMSPRTEAAYVAWVRRYVRFHGIRRSLESGGCRVRSTG